MGYINYSRSERSQEAIQDFEVPLSMINKNLIEAFLSDNNYEDPGVSVSVWKFAAHLVGPSSWHHTSSYYNKTDHFSLHRVYIILAEEKSRITELYQLSKKQNKKINFTYGVMQVQVWGGSRNHPRLIGSQTVAGIIINDWLYYLDCSLIGKYKITANKVISLARFDDLPALLEKHPEFEDTNFNKIIKEKTK